MKASQARHVEVEHKKYEDHGISLWIDSYSEIFSDFDPRPFSERAFSDDFITQVRKVSRERKGKVSILKLLVPEGAQKDEDEKVIKKRLQIFFYNMYLQLQDEAGALKRRGVYLCIGGIASMIIASYISFLNLSGFYINLLKVLFEPGGWFLLWTGLDHLISGSRGKKSEIDFYNKMSNIHVEFSSYK
jgi:hypothetical protein